MSYHEQAHMAQMSACRLNEALIKAMATEDAKRAYYLREAMDFFGELAGRVLELVTQEKAAKAPEPEEASNVRPLRVEAFRSMSPDGAA